MHLAMKSSALILSDRQPRSTGPSSLHPGNAGGYIAGLKYVDVCPRIRERLSVVIEELTQKEVPRD
jgi:hypothetical protein